MIQKNKTRSTVAAAVLASAVCAPFAHAQSNDALLDKLVEKGTITAKEANELRQESDAGFVKSLQVRNGMPDWVTTMKLYGDFRGRFDQVATDNSVPGGPNVDRNRYRYRLRTGVTATLKDSFEVGFRLTSADPDGSFGGDPISGNTTMQNGASKKFVFIDLAYGKWTPVKTGPWLVSGTFGKMENPIVASDIVFDSDYTPEGLAIQAGYDLNTEHALKFNGGFFALDEFNQGASGQRPFNDPYFLAGQVRLESKWSPKIQTSLGVTWISIYGSTALLTANVPNRNVGNTRNVAGGLVNNYTPIIGDAFMTYTLDSFPLYPGTFPIKFGGDYMVNTSAATMNTGYTLGVTFGKAAKKGTWELGYKYKYLEADANYEEFLDSDTGAYSQAASAITGASAGYNAGTGVRGHNFRIAYAPSDSFTVSATYYLFDLINPSIVAGLPTESRAGRLQVDAMWKF